MPSTGTLTMATTIAFSVCRAQEAPPTRQKRSVNLTAGQISDRMTAENSEKKDLKETLKKVWKFFSEFATSS